jgi:hypothetical protein
MRVCASRRGFPCVASRRVSPRFAWPCDPGAAWRRQVAHRRAPRLVARSFAFVLGKLGALTLFPCSLPFELCVAALEVRARVVALFLPMEAASSCSAAAAS